MEAFLRVDCQMQGVQRKLLECYRVWKKSGHRAIKMEKPSTLGSGFGLGLAWRLSETHLAELLLLVAVFESLNGRFSCHQSERIDPYFHCHF